MFRCILAGVSKGMHPLPIPFPFLSPLPPSLLSLLSLLVQCLIFLLLPFPVGLLLLLLTLPASYKLAPFNMLSAPSFEDGAIVVHHAFGELVGRGYVACNWEWC